ncbi:MAG: DMT family transporter [Geminicoccaceae bacterium]
MPGRAPAPELRGILILLVAMLLFGLMDGLSKFLSARYPTPQILFLRYACTIPLLLAVLAPRGIGRHLRSRRPLLQVARGLLLAVEIGLVVWAFGRMPLADVHALLALTPLVVTALSVPILRERVGPRRWAAVGVGFLGILIVLRPGLDVLQPAALAALASVLLYALYQVLTRLVGAVDSAATSLLWQLVIGSLASGVLMPFIWQPPALAHWPVFLLLALLGGLGHYAMIRALQLAPASVLQPFTYTLLLWAVVIGYLVFGDVPDRWTLTGAAIVVAAGTYTAMREQRLRGFR